MKPKTLPELTDVELSAKEAELRAERQRRHDEAEKAKKLRHEAHEEAVKTVLTRQLIDSFVPTHSRTSCSDKDRQNGIHSDDSPRCTRCALLDVQENGYLPDHLWVRLELSTSE